MFSSPEGWQTGYGFPYPSPYPGQFLLKDLVLLGAAIWTAGEAMAAVRGRKTASGEHTSPNREPQLRGGADGTGDTRPATAQSNGNYIASRPGSGKA